MKKHGIKLFAGTAAVGILTLTAAFFAVRYFMVGNEYASCRRGMLSRSYEMLISLLVSYRERQGAETAERISFCAAYLPLSEGSELAVQRFCADISASETDRAAGERAEKYCGELLVLLSCSRTAALSGNMPEFPAYPEARFCRKNMTTADAETREKPPMHFWVPRQDCGSIRTAPTE